ncbi:MAG: IS630 transposase-related protein [Deinococcota bacterium]
MGYSLDLRKRIVAACEAGESKSAVARRFAVSRQTVIRYVDRAAAGKLAEDKHPGQQPWLSAEQCEVLLEQVREHNDWTRDQHSEALAATTGVQLKASAIAKYFKKLGISRKKKSARV